MWQLKRLLALVVIITASLSISLLMVVAQSETGTFLQALNAEREKAELQPLQYDESLAGVAAALADDIVTGAVDDITLDMLDARIARSDYRANSAGYVAVSGEGRLGNVADYLINRFAEDYVLDPDVAHIGAGRATHADYTVVIFARPNTCNPGTQEEQTEVQREQGQAVLELVNEKRTEAGLSSLTLNMDKLYEAARWYSEDMKANGYPTTRPGGEAHVGTDGSRPYQRIERTGYNALASAENILSRMNLNAEGAFQQWWNSPPHRENILGPDVTEMALAFACNPDKGEFYYTQLFARPFAEEQPEARAAQILDAITEARRRADLTDLHTTDALTDYAMQIATHYAESGGYPPDTWEGLADVHRYDEAVTYAIGYSGDAEDVAENWLTERRDALLSRAYTHVGIGVARVDSRYFHVIFLTH